MNGFYAPTIAASREDNQFSAYSIDVAAAKCPFRHRGRYKPRDLSFYHNGLKLPLLLNRARKFHVRSQVMREIFVSRLNLSSFQHAQAGREKPRNCRGIAASQCIVKA